MAAAAEGEAEGEVAAEDAAVRETLAVDRSKCQDRMNRAMKSISSQLRTIESHLMEVVI